MKQAGKHLGNVIFITGAAGFIGYHVSKRLLEQGEIVIGFDNLNHYYDINLKYDRLRILEDYDNFTFFRGSLEDRYSINKLLHKYRPNILLHLAAQAGVRHSMENPRVYIDSNILGFFEIIEACRNYPVEHLIFASSSSVYGANKKIPFSTDDKTDAPISLYAATKKTNELLAYTYSSLYHIPMTGLRFFTVYGPYGRPDMAYFSFTKAIIEEKPIQLFNQGNLYRDFTFIDDIVTGIIKVFGSPPIPDVNDVRYKIYNIGNQKPEKLIYFVETLEQCIGKKAIKEYLPMQPGDMIETYADISDLMEDFGFSPKVPISIGLGRFVEWYRNKYVI